MRLAPDIAGAGITHQFPRQHVDAEFHLGKLVGLVPVHTVFHLDHGAGGKQADHTRQPAAFGRQHTGELCHGVIGVAQAQGLGNGKGEFPVRIVGQNVPGVVYAGQVPIQVQTVPHAVHPFPVQGFVPQMQDAAVLGKGDAVQRGLYLQSVGCKPSRHGGQGRQLLCAGKRRQAGYGKAAGLPAPHNGAGRVRDKDRCPAGKF